jgi:subtilisin family serine protease
MNLSFPAKFPVIFAAALCLATGLRAQPINWQNKDLVTDSVFGISTEKAYTLLTHKKSHPVIVGVIDSGVDTAHEDLKAVLWVNPREIPNNGIDNDHDGYIDDVHGWDFIGGAHGDVQQDNLEMTRLVREQGVYYDSLVKAGGISSADSAGYARFRKMKAAFDQARSEAEGTVRGIRGFKTILDSMVRRIGKDSPVLADWQAYQPRGGGEQHVQAVIVQYLQNGMDFGQLLQEGIKEPLEHYQSELDYHLNLGFDPRGIVGDDYNNSAQRDYGNADVTGPDALHGTHVSGIIGAVRGNGLGIDGIADNVRIMAIRVVPDGDEREKDVANGIRFAVDHGARVINMSFGKSYSKDKAAVDAAVKYAMQKDVLLVQAAGNDGEDLDDAANANYPNPIYADGSGVAGAWITVGSTGLRDDSNLVANFSNYGRTRVDVFAPGVRIYSCLPGSRYGYESGTSMAAPVVAGLAALIRSYFPKLSALEVKEIILRSVVKPGHSVIIGDGASRRVVSLDELCVSGGVVNAVGAVRLAAGWRR